MTKAFSIVEKSMPIISRASGREFGVQDVLDKFLLRGEFRYIYNIDPVCMGSMYGDKDMSLIETFVISSPQMTNSPALGIYVEHLPFHIDYAGKMSLGWGCGNNPNPPSTWEECSVFLYEFEEDRLRQESWEENLDHVPIFDSSRIRARFHLTKLRPIEDPEICKELQAIIRGMFLRDHFLMMTRAHDIWTLIETFPNSGRPSRVIETVSSYDEACQLAEEFGIHFFQIVHGSVEENTIIHDDGTWQWR